MKNYLKSWTSFLLAAFMAPALLSANHQDYYGLPGDDFSLEGALDLFKSCGSLEEFEHELNASDNTVNNLDLNHNGRIDYLRVVDHAEGDLHAIVIQALIDNGISQDVAVIEVKRNRYGEAVVQIIGDEDLYGTAKIVEPYPYDDVVGTDYYDDYYDHYSPTVFVNAWAWPSVRFIFAPRYVVWVSPYYYDYYPVWYSYWSPRPYHVWQSRTVVYHHHYCVAPNYRIPEAHHYYGARRVSAPVVHQRTETYVAQHGGRSNFDYTKRQPKVDAPRTVERSEKPNARTDKAPANTRTDRAPGQNLNEPSSRERDLSSTPRTASQPTAKNQSPERKNQPEKAPSTGSSRPRETKPQVSQPQTSKPVAPSRTEQAPRNQTRTQDAAPTRRSTQNNTRPSVAPSRETAPRANSSSNSQNRGTAKNSPSAPARPQAQPKADRSPAPNSRSSSSPSSNNPAVKSERSSQPRKGKG